MILTTGTIGEKANHFAEVLLQRSHLMKIKDDPTDILKSQSLRAMLLKRSQVGVF